MGRYFGKLFFILIVVTLITLFYHGKNLFKKEAPKKSEASPSQKTDQESFIQTFERIAMTGDLLLWSNDSIDSIVIQELTDGEYSHSALIFRDSQNEAWVADTYPNIGFRYMRIREYLQPKEFKLVKVALARYKNLSQMNTENLKKNILTLLDNQNQITFDSDLIFSADQLHFNTLGPSNYSIYCSELIWKLLKDATGDDHLYENDYDRVVGKWDALMIKANGPNFSTLDFMKLYFLRTNLSKLKDDQNKILISPNGMLRSGAFEVLKEFEISENKSHLKELIDLPDPTS